jgi:hypothetical protein
VYPPVYYEDARNPDAAFLAVGLEHQSRNQAAEAGHRMIHRSNPAQTPAYESVCLCEPAKLCNTPQAHRCVRAPNGCSNTPDRCAVLLRRKLSIAQPFAPRSSMEMQKAACGTLPSSVMTTIMVEMSVWRQDLLPLCTVQSCHVHDRFDCTHGPVAPH